MAGKGTGKPSFERIQKNHPIGQSPGEASKNLPGPGSGRRLADFLAVLAVTLLLMVPLACDIDHGIPTASVSGPPTVPSSVYSLVAAHNCAVCHIASFQYGDFSSAQAMFASVVNVAASETCNPPTNKRVIPGDAANSILILKIQGTSCYGTQMPVGGPYLQSAEIQQFVTWVNGGAKPGP